MKKNGSMADIIACLCYIILAVIVYTQTFDMPQAAGKFPRFLSVLLIIFSVLLIIVTILRRRKYNVKEMNQNKHEFENNDSHSFKYLEILSIYVIITGYIFLWDKLGYLLTSTLALFCLMLVMGERKIFRLVVTPAGITVIIYYVFHYFLKVPIPGGILP